MDFNAWLGETPPLAGWMDDVTRSTDVARAIADRATTVSVRRGGATIGTLTVRLESLGTVPHESAGANVAASAMRVLVLAQADADLQRGDRFFSGGQMYDVVQIMPGLTDRLVALAEAGE